MFLIIIESKRSFSPMHSFFQIPSSHVLSHQSTPQQNYTDLTLTLTLTNQPTDQPSKETTPKQTTVLTVGAPGFSKKMVLHLALIHSLNNLGLSAVLPLINAHLGCFGSGRSLTEVPKTVPSLEDVSSAQVLNSGPPGDVAPAPRNHGSMM